MLSTNLLHNSSNLSSRMDVRLELFCALRDASINSDSFFSQSWKKDKQDRGWKRSRRMIFSGVTLALENASSALTTGDHRNSVVP